VDTFKMGKTRIKNDYMWTALQRSENILRSYLVKYKKEDFGDKILILHPKIPGVVSTGSFHRAKKYIKIGERIAKRNLKQIKKLVK
jgi:hypothetical protein